MPNPAWPSGRAACAAIAFITLPLAIAPAAAPGQAAPGEPLVTTEWLAERLSDPELVLLHVGRPEEFSSEHIPGARHIRLEELAEPEDHEAGTGLSLQMPEPDVLARTLERHGIGDDTRVVVYFGTDWVTAATRVLLTLQWIGAGERAALLDGGMPLWKAEGRPVTSAPPEPARPGALTPRVDDSLVVSADWVLEHLEAPGVRIVDARAPVHYDGVQPTYLHREPVRKGHVPGAVNVPYNQLFDDQLRLRPRAELGRIFAGAGVRPGDTVVGYCHLGQFATAMLLAARVLGHPIRLYDGSFQEWGSRPDLPVEGPAAP